MASVALSTLWANDAADLSDALPLPLATLSRKPSREGEVRTYGGGRRRLVTRVGSVTTTDVALTDVARSTIEWIESKVGALLCFRDPMGRKFYGTFLAPSIEELDDADHANVSFTVYEVTHSEEV